MTESLLAEKAFVFQDTTATKRIFQLKQRIRAVSGGTGASKTISILIWLIDYAQSVKNEIITVVAESVPHLRLGTIRDFKAIMQAHGYWDENRWTESAPNTYKFETGTILEFISFDKFGKAHGPRRDVLFLNEANNIPYNIADQLITRTRKIVWMDWNPSEEFWFYTEMKSSRTDIDFMGDGSNYPPLTYLDNEALDETSKLEIESHKNNAQWWQVYGLGKLGEITTRTYTGWQFIDEIPHEARLERHGIDFGYDPDPVAVVDIYYYNGGYIFDEILYQRQVDNPMLAGVLKNLPQALSVADNAEPKSIAELRMLGISIVRTEKGRDSVRYGVKTVQSQKISVTRRSVNLIKEYRNFLNKVDPKTGAVIIGEYEGVRHALDAARYGLCSVIPIIERKKRLSALPIIPPRGRKNIAL